MVWGVTRRTVFKCQFSRLGLGPKELVFKSFLCLCSIQILFMIKVAAPWREPKNPPMPLANANSKLGT